MKEMELYNRWCKYAVEDETVAAELAAIYGDTEKIKDRFYNELSFGTGGMRGVIGAGSNRMNIYTVRRATKGIADYLNSHFDTPSIAISYDSRINSDLFAKEVAKVMAANGVKVYIYRELMPTPCLSFAVRRLSCDAGIMITASHNPAKYNGYKVYGADGCQLTQDACAEVTEHINKADIFHGVHITDFNLALEDGSIEYISDEIVDDYYKAVLAESIAENSDIKEANLKVVYTPLNGSGFKPVTNILEKIGVKNLYLVKEQTSPDGTFKTCPYPNPEIREALELGIALAKEKDADILIATDPDCDRAGIAVLKDGEAELISGNQTGVLLLNYICTLLNEQGKLTGEKVLVKSIVSTNLAFDVAKSFGVKTVNTLTGFKYIGEYIGKLEKGESPQEFLFGFEESYGYLKGSYVRDKDAVLASMLICQMAAYYKKQGLTLVDVLDMIQQKYGYYDHSLENFTFEGKDGSERMSAIMEQVRNTPFESIANKEVVEFCDYKVGIKTDLKTGDKSEINLPKENMLSFILEGGMSVVIRPSGTEPKMKVYFTSISKTYTEAKALSEKMKEDVLEKLSL